MTKILSVSRVLVVALILQACAPSTGDESAAVTPATGALVIVGGALQAENAAVYEAVLASRDGDGPLCVVPTASARPEESMAGAVETLTRYGGEGSVMGILISTEDPSRASDPAVVADLGRCSGFYFTGGVQSRIVDVFLPAGDTTAAYRVLWSRWQEGAVVAGSSAGAAMMSRLMIAGGASSDAVSHGIAADPDADGVHIEGGMGFFEPILDQHFLARGRIGRLLVAVTQENLPDIGFGIDENTALVVDGDSATVVGASGVVLVDGRSAQRLEPNRAAGLRVTLAGAGDVLDLQSLVVRRASTKIAVPVSSDVLELPADPFARWAFLGLLADMAASSAREAAFELPAATLRLVKADDFAAFMAADTGGVQGVPLGLSAGPFTVDLLNPGS